MNIVFNEVDTVPTYEERVKMRSKTEQVRFPMIIDIFLLCYYRNFQEVYSI